MKNIILSAFLLLSVGCTSTPFFYEAPAVYHPPWPDPVTPCNVEFKVIIVDEEPFVAVSFDDNLTLAVCDNNKKRYVEELKTIVCHYRENDPRCEE